MKLKTFAASFVMVGAAAILPASAQPHDHLVRSGHGSGATKEDHSAHESGQPGGSQVSRGQAAVLVEGKVRKVDLEAQKLTLRHGPIANPDITAMTLVFRVAGQESPT